MIFNYLLELLIIEWIKYKKYFYKYLFIVMLFWILLIFLKENFDLVLYMKVEMLIKKDF